MMRKLMIGAAAIGFAAALGGSASAQTIEVEGVIAPPLVAPRYAQPRYVYPVVERRVLRTRPAYDDDDDDCRVVIRQRVNRFGEIVERRTRVCD